jgi:hypothetical protein
MEGLFLHSSVAKLAIERPRAQGNVAGCCPVLLDVRSIIHLPLG